MWRNGSRARLRIWCLTTWGFESPHAHEEEVVNAASIFIHANVLHNKPTGCALIAELEKAR